MSDRNLHIYSSDITNMTNDLDQSLTEKYDLLKEKLDIEYNRQVSYCIKKNEIELTKLEKDYNIKVLELKQQHIDEKLSHLNGLKNFLSTCSANLE